MLTPPTETSGIDKTVLASSLFLKALGSSLSCLPILVLPESLAFLLGFCLLNVRLHGWAWGPGLPSLPRAQCRF